MSEWNLDEIRDLYKSRVADMAKANARDAELDAIAEVTKASVVVTTKKRKTPAAPSDATKKRRVAPEEGASAFQLPPIPPRNTRLAGGGSKPAGVVFVAVYDSAAVLGKVFGKLERFAQQYQLLFAKEGLSIKFMDSAHISMVALTVPKSAWMRYDVPSGAAIEFMVSAKAMHNFADLCDTNYSLTFMYDQCGRKDEPLHLMLYPRTGDMKDGQQLGMKLPSMDSEEDMVVPAEGYQYQIRVPGGLFLKDVRALAKQATTVRLMLSKTKFELAAVGENGMEILSMHIEQIKTIDGSLGKYGCMIEKTKGADPTVTMSMFRNYQIASVFLEGAANFAAFAECKECVMRMGIYDVGGQNTTMPLHMMFPFRADTPQAFTVEVWIAPKIDSD